MARLVYKIVTWLYFKFPLFYIPIDNRYFKYNIGTRQNSAKLLVSVSIKEIIDTSYNPIMISRRLYKATIVDT